MANIYDMADTWNDGATTFTAIKMNVTDTASDASSLLMDLQVGGASKFSVDKTGFLSVAGVAGEFFRTDYLQAKTNSGRPTWSFLRSSSSDIMVTLGVSDLTNPGITLSGVTPNISWGGPGYLSSPTAPAYDLTITRDAANTLAQRNGTNAQTFNLYNTYTDASNYERGGIGLTINPTTGVPVLTLSYQAAGSGNPNGYVYVDDDFEVERAITTRFRYNLAPGSGLFAEVGGIVGIGVQNTVKFALRVANDNKLFVHNEGAIEVVQGNNISALPATPSAGMIARVTDGDAGLTHGQTVVNSGAGATPYLVWYNGTNWTVIGA